MRQTSLRKRLAREAARLLYSNEATQLFQAKHEAQRRLAARDADAYQLPSKEEIGTELEALAAKFPLEKLSDEVVARLTMLRIMRLLAPFRPRWEQSQKPMAELEGHSTQVIHLCNCEVAALEDLLTQEELTGTWDPAWQVLELESLQTMLVLHPLASWEDESPVAEQHPLPANCWTISDLERRLAADLPAVDLYSTVGVSLARRDRFAVYRMLLLPLEDVEQNAAFHPEGDALYHSLQVYQLLRVQLPYDEELLLAALLHAVGLAIDRVDPFAATLLALQGFITERTAWLIESLPAAQQLLAGTLGQRAERRLREAADFDELMLLARADREGRRCGVAVDDVDDALAYLRNLAQENG